jgi:two-component system response regulator NreC
MATTQPLRIVLADDHQVVRRGLQLVLDLEPDFTVVGVAGDIASVRAMVREHQPDVLVLDLHMPGGSVFEAIPRLRADSPRTRIVVLTMEADGASVRAARSAGALGYVIKESGESELTVAVRRAAAGETYVNRRMASELAVSLMRADPSD